MYTRAITLTSSSEDRLEKNVRTNIAASEEQWLMQSRMVATKAVGKAVLGENNDYL